MPGDPYVYRGTETLKNKLKIRDQNELELIERRLVTQRTTEGVPVGDFDLAHLQAIHRQLFQDVYSWAGKISIVEISKDGSQFMFRRYIGAGMADVHRRIVKANYLGGTNRAEFAGGAAKIFGDVNHVHPIREGNGRAQIQYLKLLAGRAGHEIDLTRFDQQTWLSASKAANAADYGPLSLAILDALRK